MAALKRLSAPRESDADGKRAKAGSALSESPADSSSAEASPAASGSSHEGASDKQGENEQGPKRANLFKFAGLVAFIAIMAIVVAVAWPYIADVFSEGGVDRLVGRVQSAGAAGVLIVLGMQFLQIVVAFIPGEVVQLAAGLMYGPWLGALVVLFGCIISSTVVYKLVHALGAPFVQSMVSTEHLQKFRTFEESGKLDVIVFVLFLIPGMPKDVFTYLVPLTDMPYGKFIALTTIGRIPGVVGSTYAAAGFANGEFAGPIIVLAVLAVIAFVAIVFHDKIMGAFHRGEDA